MDALSQKDIDSLLRGAAPVAAPVLVPDIQPYNFLRPPRISRDRRATLEGIYNRFCLALQSLLSSRTRTPTDVVLTSVEQATFGEFIMSLGSPCAAFVFDLGGGVQGVMDLGVDLSLWLVDRLFGGPGEPNRVARALTQLERQAVKGITDRCLALLAEMWMDHLAMEFAHAGFEAAPEALQLASKEDNVLVANIDIRAGSFATLMTVCIPLLALEPFLQEKPAAVRTANRVNPLERAAARVEIERNLHIAHLPVAARFPLFHMRARDIASLREGQVIHTGFPLDVPLEIHVNGRRRFVGTPGQSRGLMGVRIAQVCPPGQPATHGRASRAKVV